MSYKQVPLLMTLGMLASPALAQPDHVNLIDTYCLACHNLEDWAGGLALDGMDPQQVAADAADWEKVLRKLQAGMMPPAGEPRPSKEETEAFNLALINELDNQPLQVVSSPALHRLNRNEYRNAIRDLLALDIDTSTLLPLDNASEGFDNVASGLGFSPALVQGYSSAAQKIARLALGDTSTTEHSVSYKTGANWRQDMHIEGLPLGTRGGLSFTHHFPLDAEYQFSVQGGAGFGRVQNLSIVWTLDGVPLELDNPRSFRIALPAGEHELAVALRDDRRQLGVNDIYGIYTAAGSINGVEIKGPFNASGLGNTPSRQRVLSCLPANDDEASACARRILANVATRAWREPVDEPGLGPVMAFYGRGHAAGGFEQGIQEALARILVDPRFLIRFEEEPEEVPAGNAYRIAPLELASRLSFFLWSSIPDEQLLALAIDGSLQEPEVMLSEVRRMLSDARATSLVDNFSGQWLRLRELETLTPDTSAFNDNLRQAFINETRLLVGHVVAADRPLTELLAADYTFLNERLARHYGINDVHGDYFRRVELAQDSPRRGLLGHASLLTLTSTASRTSPVIRGSWILENLLHAPVPAPPPGVETNLDGDGTTIITTSVRERLEQHRDNPSCQGCHSVIDPVGFALENFDLIGAWREFDGDSRVDASGVLVDGTPVNSPVDLRLALLERQELFVSTFIEKLLTYALGRKLEYYDMPVVRAILRDATGQDYRFSAIVEALVQSPLFLQRSKSQDASGQVAVNAALQRSAAP